MRVKILPSAATVSVPLYDDAKWGQVLEGVEVGLKVGMGLEVG